jgi:N-acetylglucosaminyldiphosphoundecaprenol N-acetyl-beta-D-mannosaminyltransferase
MTERATGATFVGLRFADLDAEAAASLIASRPENACFGYLVTPNADHLIRLLRLPELRPAYERATLCCLDSVVVARLAGALGLRPPRVATGADIVEALLTRHLRAGDRLTIIGLAPAALPALAARLRGVRIAHHAPPAGFARDPAAFDTALRFALANPARFTLIALGSPAQERLAAATAGSGGARGYGLCIGAALDFLAGVQPRAPRFAAAAWPRMAASPLPGASAAGPALPSGGPGNPGDLPRRAAPCAGRLAAPCRAEGPGSVDPRDDCYKQRLPRAATH